VRSIDPKHMDSTAAAPAPVPPAPMKPLPPSTPIATAAPKPAAALPLPAPNWVSPVSASTSPARAPTRPPSADITVESVDTALPPVLPVVQPKPKIFLQVGAFSDLANASRVADQINKAGLGPVSIVETQVNGRSVRRVRVGPLADVDTADRLTERIAGMGLPRPQVAVD
jgi:rare lipoprotein A